MMEKGAKTAQSESPLKRVLIVLKFCPLVIRIRLTCIVNTKWESIVPLKSYCNVNASK